MFILVASRQLELVLGEIRRTARTCGIFLAVSLRDPQIWKGQFKQKLLNKRETIKSLLVLMNLNKCNKELIDIKIHNRIFDNNCLEVIDKAYKIPAADALNSIDHP